MDGGDNCCFKHLCGTVREDDCVSSFLLPSIFFFIEILLTVVFVVIAYSETKPETSITIDNIQVLSIFYMCIAIIGMMYMYCKQLLSKNPVAELAEEEESGTRYLTAGLYAFGSGSLVIDILSLFAYAQCMETEAHLFFHIFRVVFIFLQMLFLQKFSNARIEKCCSYVFILFHVMATNLSQWVYFTVRDAGIATASKKNNSKHMDCLTQSNVTTLLEDVESYGAPFVLEFLLTSAGMIYAATSGMKRNRGTGIKERQALLQAGPSSAASDISNITKTSTVFSRSCSVVNAGQYPGFIVGLAVSVTIAVSELVSKQHRDVTNSLVFQHMLATIVSLTQITCFFYLAYQLRENQRISRSLRINDTLLIVSYVGIMLFALLFLVASSFDIANHELPLPISRSIFVSTFFVMLQTTAQTWFIVRTRRIQNVAYTTGFTEEKIKENKIQQIIIYLIMTNISLWVVDSFFELKDVSSYYPVVGAFFKGQWQIYTHICSPLVIFFRFHSAAVLFEISAKFIVDTRADLQQENRAISPTDIYQAHQQTSRKHQEDGDEPYHPCSESPHEDI